ncbi:MAG: hypothetical protein MUF80_00770, partial [Burkholderiales bacterium]|nr:hypothetical protein [Burkholderiales bacterium]
NSASAAGHQAVSPETEPLGVVESRAGFDALASAGRFAESVLSGCDIASDDAVAAKSATQVVRTTRTGEKAVRITRADGSVVDISPQRVKEYVPNTHPNAPPGTLDRVRFPNAQPGSKGLKRDPTAEELEILRNLP